MVRTGCASSCSRRRDAGGTFRFDAVAARSPPEVVRLLLRLCPDAIRALTPLGEIALHLAFREVDRAGAQPRPDPDVIRALLGAWPESVRVNASSGWLPLHLAVNLAYEHGCAPLVIEILRLVVAAWPDAVGMRFEGGRTALHHLLRSPLPVTLEAVRLLVDAFPAVLEARDDDEILPVHDAATKDTVPLEVLEYLADRRPESLGEADEGGCLSLHLAAPTSSVDKVRFLVERRPGSVVEANHNGCTALHAAAARTDTPAGTIRALVRLPGGKAPLRMRNHSGAIPLHLAAEGTSRDKARSLHRAWPPGVRQRDDNGNLPLHAALYRGSPPAVVKYLLGKHRHALQVRNHEGLLPVQVALKMRNMDAARLLLRMRPASVEETDDQGRNLFHFLLDLPHDDDDDDGASDLLGFVKLLVEHGGGPEAARATDRRGRAPLHVAAANPGPATLDVVYFLLRDRPDLILAAPNPSQPARPGLLAAAEPPRKRARTL